MIKIYTEQIAQLLKMAENAELEISEAEILQFICVFQKIIQVILCNNTEYQLALGKYKLQSKFKRYNNRNCLVINMKRNKN